MRCPNCNRRVSITTRLDPFEDVFVVRARCTTCAQIRWHKVAPHAAALMKTARAECVASLASCQQHDDCRDDRELGRECLRRWLEPFLNAKRPDPPMADRGVMQP